MQLGILIASNNATSATPVVAKSDMNRVAKCHGYDGYIRVKDWQVCVKKLGGPKLSKTIHFLEDLCNKCKTQWTNEHGSIVYPHLFITRNLFRSVLLVLSAKNVAIYALFSG